MTAILFYLLSAICIISSILMIFHKNAMYSVLFLLICFFSVAGLYVMLNAQFLAIVHIIVYAGAIMVLFLYVIMFLNMSTPITIRKSKLVMGIAVLTGSSLCFVLVTALWATNFGQNPAIVNQDIGLASTLGKVLFNEFLIPFEVSSVLFLSSMVGIVIFNKKEQKDE
ncbi:MAG: NADH-quinone oxidoreductase subunit J [Saprospiraceae bacterium]|nr:NADH-quinone oxidoreductase subunit J [Saprospiraceae bacterium]MBK7697961.1 NADH-quinone oxidoreductase subunit J [Saprospiraceae bacterium]MBK8887760.1 NADH-quinone oxidoreductase subunit J [Saprospiraceae bacterium]MBK9580874.1 NADH-quinone oxidoreductase subunit J [Saprospiraceae bacterium]MBK9745086.1 NADH-quinone oxidoreductase subunit J [Saprospiraceae bacterium]